MAEKKSTPKNAKRAKPPTATAPTPEQIAEKQRHAGVLATSGLLHAAAVMEPLQKNLVGADATADAIYTGLDTKLKTVQAGDMTPVESMLLSQAMSLQTIYASLARKATSQEYLKQYQTFLTLALKAQAQSRATLEALIELKHPRHPPTFVKQANIANGPQQVNQYGAPGEFRDQYAQAPAHAGKKQIAPNELLEAPSHERMDTGAQTAAGRGHQVLEPVGAVDRAQER